jgi:nucleotide-binding universal stress UspA family protein
MAAAYVAGAPYDGILEEKLREDAQDYLAGTARRLEGAAPVPVSASLLEGDVAATLCAHAADTGADLVVMATHGRGPLGRFWLGSVADEVLRRLPVPLLLVRPGEEPPDLAAEPALRRVLVPLDGDPLAEQVLEPAAALAQLVGAEITLLRVVRPAGPVPADLPEGAAGREAAALLEQVRGLHRQVLREAEGYLTRVAGRLRAPGRRVQTKVVVGEHAASAILDEARDGGADLIALATHGRHGLPRLLLGSVADKVVRGAAAPVLVLRPQGR